MKVKLIAGTLLCSIFCAWILLVFSRTSGGSSPTSESTSLEDTSQSETTMTFDDWLNRYERIPAAVDPAFIRQGVALARQRQADLKQLVQADPQAALDMSISSYSRNALPDEIKSLVEVPFRSSGNVEIFMGCGAEVASIEYIATLEDGTRFRATPTPGNRFSESVHGVPLSGVYIDGVGALQNAYFKNGDPYKDDPVIQTAHSPEATIEHTMHVLLVDFPDMQGAPVDATLLQNLINGEVAQQIYEMSNHQVTIVGTVDSTVHRLPNPITYYEPDVFPMHDDALSVSGVNLDDYDTVCVFFAEYQDIEFAGYATLPGKKMWINGFSSNFTDETITHELGHNFGSFHASSWNVTSADPVDPAGASEEYGDLTDIMGFGAMPRAHFHVQNKLQIDWLGVSNFTDVTTSGTYRVYRSDHAETDDTAAAIRGLRILKSSSPNNEYYWLGYRQQYEDLEAFGRGLYVLWQQHHPQGYQKSHWLDMTPGSETDGTPAEKLDGGLALGRTYSDATAQIHITPIARGGWEPNQYMEVVVNIGDVSGNSAPSASQAWPSAGNSREALVFEVTAIDADGDDLAYSWDFGDGLVKPNSPIVSHAWSVGGTYSVSCTVSDMKGGTDTVSASITISDELEDSWGQSTISTADLNDIVNGDGTLVIVGDVGLIARSSDGANWTTDLVSDTHYLGNNYLQSIIYDGSMFIAAGVDYDFSIPGWVGIIYTSTDATTWTRQVHGGFRLWDVAHHNGVYIAVGDTVAVQPPPEYTQDPRPDSVTILRSTNGTTWTPVGTGISGNYKSVVHTGSTFLVTANGPVIMTSPDGITWTDKTTGGFDPNLTELALLNGSVFGSGFLQGIKRTSDDGTTFDSLNDDPIQIAGFGYGNNLYFGAGRNSFDATMDLNFVSVNGSDWTQLSTTSQSDRNATVFFNDCIITVGNSGAVWKSPTIQTVGDGWGAWELLNRGGLGFNRDPEDDADCDGAKNIVEYALGTDATDPSSVPLISSYQDIDGHLVISIPRKREAPDLNHVAVESTGLDGAAVWTTANQVTNTSNLIEYRTTAPLSSISPQFLRLRVEISPPVP